MCRQGRELIDGEGSARVAVHMRAAVLRMLPVTVAHRTLLWQWVNDPQTRAASFNSEPIGWDEHVSWLDGKLADPRSALLLGVDGQGRPVGHVRFDRSGSEATISVHVDPALRGKAWGSALILRACEEAAAGDGAVHAYVKAGNWASERAFLRAGFVAVGAASVRGQEALHLSFQRGSVR
jgi:UDP-2,4-diacetamido-2,4,6-trideoxy-beta-L-altropyranose hydrolase